MNRNVDMFFSNKSYDPKSNNGTISIYSFLYKKEGESFEHNIDFQIKVDFPETTKNLKLVLEKDQDDVKNAMSDENLNAGKSKSKSKSSSNSKNQNYTAGVNYLLSAKENFTSVLKFGLRIDMPINPSLKANFDKFFTIKHFTLELSQDFILYRQEGFSEITSLILSEKWNNKFQTDLVNNLAWDDQSDYFQLRNNFLVYYHLGDEKLLSFSIGANAKIAPIFNYESYDTSISYRQLIYDKWLYSALTLGADFSKSEQFNMKNFIQLRFEALFK